MKRRRHASSAFTLVEILVAVSLTPLAFAALPVTHRVIARALERARNGTAAVALAQAKLEEIIADPAAAAPGGRDTPAVGGARFERRWAVALERPADDTWRVAVTVRSGGWHAVTLETLAWAP
jgi:type II secretory pathway pseudopilin PulG